MDMLRILLIAACAIRVVNPLPQPVSDWSLFDSYEPSAFLSADAPTDANILPYSSNLAMGAQTNDWDSYDLGGFPSESGAGLETPTNGDDILWDDSDYSDYSSTFDLAGTGCSGAFSKRGDGESMCTTPVKGQAQGEVQDQAPAQEQNPCDPDKEPQCCIPSWMFRSRWAGGGHNMDGCSECTYLVPSHDHSPGLAMMCKRFTNI